MIFSSSDLTRFFVWGQQVNGTNVFEERVVAFEALSEREVFEKAMKESEWYSKKRGGVQYEIFPDQIAYLYR